MLASWLGVSSVWSSVVYVEAETVVEVEPAVEKEDMRRKRKGGGREEKRSVKNDYKVHHSKTVACSTFLYMERSHRVLSF